RLDLNVSGTLLVNTAAAGGANIANNGSLTIGPSSVIGAFVAVSEGGNLTTSAPVTAGSVNFSGLNITLDNVTTSGNQAYNTGGLITLNGTDYRSNGGSISFNGDAVLAAPAITVDTTTGTGDITFGGTVNGATALTLAADGGNISITG